MTERPMYDPVYYSPEYQEKTSMVSSRIAKQEQQKLVRQTVMLAVMGVVILVAFVFLVVPGMIRILALLKGTGPAQTAEDTLAPQTPIISAPLEATRSAQLTLTGFGEAGSELVVLVNGQEKSRTVIPENGDFSLSFELSQGENIISAFAVDGAGNESAESRNYTVVYDNEVPTLELEQPKDGQEIELRKNQVTTIKGKTEANARVLVNGRMVYADKEGVFSTTYSLAEGENILELKVEDLAGNTTEQKILVKFRY